MNQAKLKVETSVSAPAKKVWDYYTQPEHIVKWNFATDEWQCPVAKNDLKVGGRYFARMEAKDGSFGFDFEAVYDDVAPLKRLMYTMSDGRQAIITFEESNKATKVITIFDAEKSNPTDLQQKGWQAILNNFKKYTESN